MLDTLRTFETPEGIDLNMEVAGPLVRILAYTIDLLINFVLYIVIAIIAGLLGQWGAGIGAIAFFILYWFYPVFFEVVGRGMTPGKKMFKIRVVHDDGSPVDWSASMVRNLLRVVDFLPFSYTFGLIAMVFNRDFKRLGDMAAGTMVIYNDKTKKQLEIPKQRPRNMPVSLTLKEQQSIIGFAERHQMLSRDRSKELANILSPLLGKTDGDAVTELYQVAAGLRGNR
ncbi:MAG: RDD family protein [Proteobacteria bacterium]|nr:RDD family protein [Pseudomonadota bacterium]